MTRIAALAFVIICCDHVTQGFVLRQPAVRKVGEERPSTTRMHATFYRMWDDRYAEEGFAYGTEPNGFLKESLASLKLPENAKCLLLAEGEGRNAVYMAQSSGFRVTAVDNSKVGLDKAKKLAESRGVEIETVVANLAEYDLGSEQWDCIVGIFCHLPPPLRSRVLASIPSALRPGGCVLFEVYTPDQLEHKTGGPPKAELMYSSQIFRDAFGDTLTIERNEEMLREVVEGKYHTGEAAVVQFIGRKMSS